MSSRPYQYQLQSFVSKDRNFSHSSPFDDDELIEPLLLASSNSLSTITASPSEPLTPTLGLNEDGIDRVLRRRQNRYAIALLFLAASVLLLTPFLSIFDLHWLNFRFINPLSSSYGPSCGCGMAGDNFCTVYGSQVNLQRSRIYEGTGVKIDKVLQKALSGDSLVIGVMGGSVSACHGVPVSPSAEASGCYVNQVINWFRENIPVKGGHTVHNGAVGGMDSSYYAFCGTSHIPSNVDLVILEFDVNDRPTLEFMVYFDQLVRITLQLPSQPAVLVLGVWGPAIAGDLGALDPQAMHLPVAEYYDVPYISMKQLIWDHYLRFPRSTLDTFWTPDGFHPNTRGHRVLADLITSYLSTRMCHIRSGVTQTAPRIIPSASFSEMVHLSNTTHHWDSKEEDAQYGPALYLEDLKNESYQFITPSPPLTIPPIPFNLPHSQVLDLASDSENHLHLDSPKPFCADANNPDSPLDPRERDGWEPYVWKNEKHFWVSSTPGARMIVDITVNEGRVAVFYFRSQDLSPGVAQCWVDDNVIGAKRLDGHWDLGMNIPTVSDIDQNVTAGNHYVTCEILEESSAPNSPDPHHFRLVAIMAT